MKLDLLGNIVTVHEMTAIFAEHSIAVMRDSTGTGYDADTIKDEALLAKVKDCCGAASKATANIIIDKDLPASLKVDTLLHECIHMIKYLSVADNEFLSEAQIQIIALGMFNLLARNHHLLDWIKDNTKDLDRSLELMPKTKAGNRKHIFHASYICRCGKDLTGTEIKYGNYKETPTEITNFYYCSKACYELHNGIASSESNTPDPDPESNEKLNEPTESGIDTSIQTDNPEAFRAYMKASRAVKKGYYSSKNTQLILTSPLSIGDIEVGSITDITSAMVDYKENGSPHDIEGFSWLFVGFKGWLAICSDVSSMVKNELIITPTASTDYKPMKGELCQYRGFRVFPIELLRDGE